MSEQGFQPEITEVPPITSIAGERAGLRRISPEDHKDVERMFHIEQSRGMRERIVEDPEDIETDREGIKRWIKETGERRSVQLFAVSANKTGSPQDHGEVDGWLRIDGENSNEGSGERNRFQRITGSTLPRNAPTPYEITYIKRPGSPRDLMAGAVLQACHMIAAQDAEKQYRYRPSNKGAIEPRRIVMAFADQDNADSIEVLRKTGFECLKSGVSWDEEGKPNKNMYVLNWDRYHELMATKEQLLLQRLQELAPETFSKGKAPKVVRTQPDAAPIRKAREQIIKERNAARIKSTGRPQTKR